MGMNYPTAREEQAAYWYLRLQEPDVPAEDIQTALAWQSDPENRAAFERVEAFWRAWPRDLPSIRDNEPRKRTYWSAIAGAAAALIAIVSIASWIVISRQHESAGNTAQEHATSIGQIRTVWLEDGSEVILGGATSIRAHFTADVRRVIMSSGEALFVVAKDAARPFIVDVPNGSAQALGTAFNVHHGPDEATITVLEGKVRVSPPLWRSGASASLSAGTQVAVSTDGALGSIKEVNPREIAPWRSGRMIFVDRSLRSVIADLNRYSRRPVTLAVPQLADVRVSGNVKLDQMEEWLRALGPVIGVDVVQNEHGTVLVSAEP